MGFQPLANKEVEEKLREACNMQSSREGEDLNSAQLAIESRSSITTLAKLSLQDLLFLNGQLREYCNHFMGLQHFGLLGHLDITDLVNVYKWRMEQESGLRNTKGIGMSDVQVVDFSKSNTSNYIY